MFSNWSPREIILLVIACTIPMLLCMLFLTQVYKGMDVDEQAHQSIRDIIYMLVGLLAGALGASGQKKAPPPSKAGGAKG